MYNDNEMYDVRDFDDDVKERRALIEEAKALDPDAEWNALSRQISNLQRRWRRIYYWESVYEDTLTEEFEGYIDAIYGKRREGWKVNQTAKEELIEQARKLSNSTEWNATTKAMADLMEQWKAVGSAGKEMDDKLWESFSKARQIFFDRKHEYWANAQARFDNALKVKEELVAQAAALADSVEWQKTNEKMKTMMEQWKAAGSAGREHEDRLWDAFNESRQAFFTRRNAYYEELHAKQDANLEKKKALVEKAREIEATKEYTKDNTEAMKQLGVDWKEAGSCRKEKEDEIWNEFRSIMDEYFDGLKQFNEMRHQQWIGRMNDAKNRKMELVANQKRQLARLEKDKVGALGQAELDEIDARIKDKEEFIKELEDQIADIEKSLEK